MLDKIKKGTSINDYILVKLACNDISSEGEKEDIMFSVICMPLTEAEITKEMKSALEKIVLEFMKCENIPLDDKKEDLGLEDEESIRAYYSGQSEIITDRILLNYNAGVSSKGKLQENIVGTPIDVYLEKEKSRNGNNEHYEK